MSQDRVVEAPSAVNLPRRKVLQAEDWENITMSAVKDVQEGGNNMPKEEKYVMDRIVDHSYEKTKRMF